MARDLSRFFTGWLLCGFVALTRFDQTSRVILVCFLVLSVPRIGMIVSFHSLLGSKMFP